MEKFVSRLVESKRIILTGSNAKMLSKELSTYMTGRHIDNVLLPFSYREFLDYNEVKHESNAYTTEEKADLIKNLESYLKIGGFPLALKIGREFLADLYKDMVQRDVIQRYKIRNASKLSDFTRYLISNSSCEISYSKLRNIFEIASKHTVQDWIGYLENSYLLFKIDRFSFKLKESVIAPKKIYGIDTGLISAVALSSDISKLMESAVAIELIRRKFYWQKETEINYWRDYNQHEADFTIRKGNTVLEIIQVTYASNKTEIKKRETDGAIYAAKELKCKNISIITWDYEQREKIGEYTIIFIPLWKWLLKTESNPD